MTHHIILEVSDSAHVSKSHKLRVSGAITLDDILDKVRKHVPVRGYIANIRFVQNPSIREEFAPV